MGSDMCLADSAVGTQGSFVTIFSMWNTLMGTSLLAMPWAVAQAGIILGVAFILVIAAVNLYTVYLVTKFAEETESKVKVGEVVEFADVCKAYLGRAGEVSSVFISFLTMVGIVIVHWVLMSNLLYNIVHFVYSYIEGLHTDSYYNVTIHNDKYIQCTDESLLHRDIQDSIWSNKTSVFTPSGDTDLFHKYWHLKKTVPFFLLCLLVPLINFKSPTFFTKFNALGILSAFYLLGFITYKTSRWGFHMNFNQVPGHYARASFPTLTGVGAMSFYFQSYILSIMRHQKNPKNNVRDMTIAYICVALTYCYVACVFYCSWPMISKDCIDQNLLNNLIPGDPLAFVARIFIFLQLITVYPLTLYIMRVQLMKVVFGSIWPSWKHVAVMNIGVVGSCLIFARFLPQIGTIIRYTGSFGAQSYGFILPSIVYVKAERKKGTLTFFKVLMHVLLVVVSFANVVGQFFIK